MPTSLGLILIGWIPPWGWYIKDILESITAKDKRERMFDVHKRNSTENIGHAPIKNATGCPRPEFTKRNGYNSINFGSNWKIPLP